MTIYLDYAATTPVDPRVAAVMAEVLTDRDTQAQSRLGHARRRARRAATSRVGARRDCRADRRRGARDHLHLRRHRGQQPGNPWRGARARARAAGAAGSREARAHLVSARTEHKSVLDALRQLEKDGFAVTLVEPDEAGRVPLEAIETALRTDTLLVSVMLANNETGVVNDVAQIAARVRERGALMHTDASQAVGKLRVDVRQLGVDFLSFTAHKFYGPKGIGALYVRENSRPRIAAVQLGGGHERGLSSGTLPTHQIAGFAAAAGLARKQGDADAAHARDLAGRLERELETIPGVTLQPSPQRWRARSAQRLVRWRGRREPGHRLAGDCGLDGFGLQLGHA